MKNPTHPRFIIIVGICCLALLLSLPARAANITKAGSGTDLTDGASWNGSVAPAASDIAVWDTGSLGAGLTLNSGAPGWLGLTVSAGATDPINIGSGGTLTVGTSGINMSASTINATIGCDLSLASGYQSWSVASGKTLAINGTLTRAAGASMSFPTTGVSSTTLTNDGTGILGGWATVTGTGDWAATNSSGNITNYTGYTSVTGTQTGAGASALNWKNTAGTTLTASATVNSLNQQFDFTVNSGVTLTLGSGGLILGSTERWLLGTSGTIKSGLPTGELYIHANTAAFVNGFQIQPAIADGLVATTVIKDGNGQCEMGNATNTFSGGFYLNAGAVYLGSSSTGSGGSVTRGPLGTGLVTLNGGTLFPYGKNVGTTTTAGYTLANNINIPAGASATINNGGLTAILSGNISGVVPTFLGAGITALQGANSYVGNTTITVGTLAIGNTAGVNNNLSTGAVIVTNGSALRVGYAVTSNVNRSYTPNDITLAGTLYAEDAWQFLTGNINVTSNSIMGSTYNNAGTEQDKGLFICGVLSGSTPLTVQHSRINTTDASYITSFVAFTNNANTYSGTITINENTTGNQGGVYLGVNGSTALANATINVPGPVVGLNPKFGSSPLVFSSGLGGSATLGALTGNGPVVLAGYDEVGHAYNGNIALTVGANNSSTSYGGVLSGGGSLIKAGTGTFTLTGTNTYTGTTTISAGNLTIGGAGRLGGGSYFGGLVNNSFLTYSSSSAQALSGPISGSGSLTNNGPGALTLGGSQSSSQNNVTVNDGAILNEAFFPSAQLTATSLTVGTTTGASLGFVANSTSVARYVAGTLTLNGTATINILGGNFAAGSSYPLIAYTTLAGGGSYTLGALPSGVTGNLSTVGNTIYFNVTSVTNTIWTGLVSGAWDINTTANWTNPATLGNKYIDGSVVQFDDTGINTTTISNAVATTLTPGSVLVTNNTLNYAFKTNTIIAGSAGLTKTGVAALTNSTPNTYTGPTVINQGAVVAGVASVANVSGALGNNSAVTLGNDATAVLNLNGFATQIGSLAGGGAAGGNVALGSATLTTGGDNSSTAYAGTISGTGGLTKTGNGTLTFSGTNNYTGATTVSAGTVTYASGAVVTNGSFRVTATGIGSAIMNVGSSSTVNVGGGLDVGYVSGNGIVNLNGGTLSSSGSGVTAIARSTAANHAESGTFNVNSGTFNSAGDLVVGLGGTMSGIMNLSSGVVNVGTTATRAVHIGQFDSVTGLLNITNGALNLYSNSFIRFTANGGFGTNAVNQVGGTVTFYSDNGVTPGGTGNLDLARAGGAAAVNSYNLNGGTLTVPQIISSSNTPTRIFNFNGGTLKPTASSATFFDLGTGNAYANVRNNGAIIDTTNFNVTIAQPLQHSTIDGDNATDGGLTKTGNGTLTMGGGLSYTGPTKVLGGTLVLDAAFGLPSGGNLTVSNAILTLNAVNGSMSVGSVSVGSTLNLSLNNSGGAISGSGNMTLGSNTTNNLSYIGALSSAPTTAPIKVSGTLTKGTNIVFNISAIGLQPNWVVPLVEADSTAMTTNGFVLGSLPSGIKAVLTNDATYPNTISMRVISAGQLLTWRGASDGSGTILYPNWNINTDTNWINVLNTADQVKYLQYLGNTIGDNVIFGDSGYNTTGTNEVNLSVAVVPATVTFSASAPYTLTGAGGIGGETSVVLTNESSSVYLGTANTYTGGTAVSGGTLIITNDNALGNAAGPVSLTGGTLQLNDNVASGRALSVNANSSIGVIAGATAPWSGVLSGTGTLTKTDNGTLNISANNTFAGSTVVSAGTLNYSGTVTNNLVTVGNVASVNAKLGISGNVLANSLLVGNNSSAAASVTQTAGNVFINGGGGDCMSVGNLAGAYGYYNAAGGTLTVNGIAVGGENNTGSGFSGTGGDGIMEINGGTVNNIGWLVMARGATAETGILNVFSGSLAFAGGGLQPNWGAGQTSIINIMGGSVSSTNVPVNFRNAGNIGILNLNGGVLQPAAVTGAGVLNFNGGTLIPATNFATPFVNLSSNIYVYSGGAKIDDNGQTLTINQPLLAPTGYGASSIALGSGGSGYIAPPIVTISGGNGANATAIAAVSGGVVTGITVTSPGNGYLAGDEASMTVNFSGGGGTGASATVNPLTPNTSGGLVKKGAGVLTLSGANTYTGITVVTNGSLLLSQASQAGGAVVVADNARFGVVAGSVSNSATIGALTMGSSVNSAATLDFVYSFAGNPTNAALAAGAVTLNGATNSIHIGGSFALGAFPVLKYTSLSGTFKSTVSAPRGMGASVSNDTVNKVIYVVVNSLSSPIVWTGTNSIVGKTNLWDLNTTTNWLIAGSPTTYQETLPPGDAVLFNDTGSSLVLLSNTASPAGMTISNTAVNYTFQGSGQINSVAGLTKVGSGTVTLNLPGTYSVSTVVSNGTISLGTNQTFANLSGNGTVATASGAPTVTATSSTNTTFSGSLQGALNLTKTGNNTLTLTGTNTFSGNVFGKGGTLVIDNGAINGGTQWASIGQDGTDNATLTLKGTGSFTNNADFNVGDIGSATGTLNISNTAALLVNSLYVASANTAGSTASGTVNQAGGTVQNQFLVIGGRGATSTNGVGVYNLSGGSLTVASASGGRIGNFGAGTLNISGTGTANLGSGTSYVGYRTGYGKLNMTGGSLSAGGDFRVAGSDANGTQYIATGIVTVANATVNLGSLTIARGNNNQNSINGEVYINSGATVTSTNDVVVGFAGTGHGMLALGGGTLNVGTTVTKWMMVPQYDTTTAEVNITNGALNLNASSCIRFSVGNTSTAGTPNVINQKGGAVTFYSDFATTIGGVGVLDMAQSGAASVVNTYNLDGGVLTVPQVVSATTLPTRIFNFNGGTLKAAGSSTAFFNLGTGNAFANVRTGGAIIDTAGNSVTIAQALINNGIDEDGGLTKNGNGTLTLNGINTYTNVTMVNAGTLGGTGTIAGRVVVNSNAGLAPGSGGIGTLTVNGNLTLNGLSTNVFEVNGTTPASDRVAAGASVTYGGVLKIVPAGSFTVGQQFQLFSGTGATNAGNFASVQSTDAGTAFSFTNGILSVTAVGPTGSNQLTNSVTGGGTTLSLSWGAGWKLQMQTNSLTTGLGTNWTYITDGTLTSTNLTIDATKPTVFYRLVYP